MGQVGMDPISTNTAGLNIFESKSLSSPSQKLAFFSHFEFSSEFNHQLNTLLLFHINQMSYFLELSWLSQFSSTIWDTWQVCRVKNKKNKILILLYLRFHQFPQFDQLFPLFLPYIIKNPLISVIVLLQKHEFYKFSQFLFTKSVRYRILTLKSLNFSNSEANQMQYLHQILWYFINSLRLDHF